MVPRQNISKIAEFQDWSKSQQAQQLCRELKLAMGPSASEKMGLDKLREIAFKAQAFSTPFNKLPKAIAQLAGVGKNWAVDETVLKQFRKASWLKEFERLFEGFGSGVARALEAQKKALAIRLPEVDWEGYLRREGESLLFAASFGWFIQPESDANISQLLEGNPEQLDALFIHFVERDMAAIEQRLLRDHPGHAHVIEEAFRLHREERYIASVPIFLLVADGLSKASTGKSVYTGKSKGAPQIADWACRQEFDSWNQTFFSVLCKHHALSQHTPGRLNRHKVLHGEDLSYNTKTNSLRALSFVGFVGWLLAPDDQMEA